MTKVTGTLEARPVSTDLSPEAALLVPKGRARVMLNLPGQEPCFMFVRARRRLKSGWTRFYFASAE